MNITNIPDSNLTPLIIDKNHLVRTGFMDHFNVLLDTTIYNVYLDSTSSELVFQRDKGDITLDFSLSGMPDVDLTGATNGSTIIYNGTNWIVGSGDALNYVRTETSTRFPDITSVSSVVDALDKILYPYQYPGFTSFLINKSVLELGQYLSTNVGGNETFTWSVSNIDNVSTIGYTITDVTNNIQLDTNITPKTVNSKIINIPYGIVKSNNNETHRFKITTKNTKLENFEREYQVVWRPRIFWGTSSNTTLNNSDILNLPSSVSGGSKLTSSIQQQFLMNGDGKYIWICMPVSFGAAINVDGSSSRFVVGGLANSAWERFTVSFTNNYSHVENYYLYKTETIQFGTGIDIKIV